MKHFLSVFLIFFCFSIYGQTDDKAIREVCIIDTVILIDTTYVVDTISFAETSIAIDDRRKTIYLDSINQSWSLIPEDSIEDIYVRRDSGILLLSGKVGFSNQNKTNDWKGYSINTLPPLILQVEYFQNDLFSYGGHILFSRSKFTNDTLSTTFYKDNIFGIAALGTFHYGSWLQNITHNWFKFGYLDLYASIAIRMDIHRQIDAGVWNETTNQYEEDVINKDTKTEFMIRPIFGARYYITDQFSLNIEVGRGNMGMLSASASWIIPYKK